MPNSTLPYETAVTSTLSNGSRVSVTDASDMAKLLVRTKRQPVGADVEIPSGLPSQGHAQVGGQVLIAATRPSEWTILGQRGMDVADLVPPGATVVDLTHGRSAVRLSGVGAPEVLAQLCSLDFSDDFTPNGAVISGAVSSVMCDIIRDDMDDAPSYVLLFDRSFADFFSTQIVDVASYLNQHPLRGH